MVYFLDFFRLCLLGYVTDYTPTDSPTPAPTQSPSSSSPTSPTTKNPTSYPTTVVPTTVPSAAPSMPPTLIHLTYTWSGYSTSGAGCPYSGGVTQYLNTGFMTWKNCMYMASEFGAMLFSNAYTIQPGWGAHRLGTAAEYISSWSTYATLSLYSNGDCILGRDPTAGLVNYKIPSNTMTYENDVWFYQDFGYMYYDQCQNAAGLYGASIITPVSFLSIDMSLTSFLVLFSKVVFYFFFFSVAIFKIIIIKYCSQYTIGLIGDNYWLSSTHQCNTYEYITNGGTTMGIENLGAYARSASRLCMIGYVNFYTPTASPTPAPTTVSPTSSPTLPTTVSPTVVPTVVPSAAPSSTPTTALPTTSRPTTVSPSAEPSSAPTTWTPTLPTTTTPTSIPTSSPTMPPTLIHLTTTWPGSISTASGCTYSAGVNQYLNAGYMTWKACIYAASNYGAMLFGTQYYSWGWGAHRLNTNAEYVVSWPTYSTQPIYTPGTCVLARDPNSGSTNNLIPSSTTTYENDVWFYQDMGSLYYDQCQTAAGLHGASIITPVY